MDDDQISSLCLDCLRVDSADIVVPIVEEAEENPAVLPLEEDSSFSQTPPRIGDDTTKMDNPHPPC